MSKYQINFLRGGRLGLLPMLAVAAALFVGGNVRAASGDSQASQLLAASLPSGVTLKSASDSQMEEAVKAAVASNPSMAEGIVRVAIITKVPASERNAAPKRMRRAPKGDGKSMSQNGSTYNPWAASGVTGAQPFVIIAATTSDPAGYIAAIVAAAVAAAPDLAPQIAAAAAAAAPAYAVQITQAAQQAAPSRASAIASAVSAVVPSQAEAVTQVAGGGGDNGGAASDSPVGAPSFPAGGGAGGGTGVTDLTPTETPTTNT